MTLLLVTHDPHVGEIAGRQLRLEEGQLVEVGGTRVAVTGNFKQRSA